MSVRENTVEVMTKICSKGNADLIYEGCISRVIDFLDRNDVLVSKSSFFRNKIIAQKVPNPDIFLLGQHIYCGGLQIHSFG